VTRRTDVQVERLGRLLARDDEFAVVVRHAELVDARQRSPPSPARRLTTKRRHLRADDRLALLVDHAAPHDAIRRQIVRQRIELNIRHVLKRIDFAGNFRAMILGGRHEIEEQPGSHQISSSSRNRGNTTGRTPPRLFVARPC
jgi:hypothetical protein